MKIECSRQVGQKTDITTPWAPVRAKNIMRQKTFYNQGWSETLSKN